MPAPGRPQVRKIKIHNVMSNIVGRTRTERIYTKDKWQKTILPVLKPLLQDPQMRAHKARIGRWVVEYAGNNDHMHEFFVKNWKEAPAGAEAQVRTYVITGIKDPEIMKKLLSLNTDADVSAYRDGFLKEIQQNAKYRSNFRDPKLREIDKYPDAEQLQIALFAPAALYCSEELTFVILNTNYYGQLKSKASLGPLEEFLIRKAKVDKSGRIQNLEDVWISMHAGCVEYRTEKNGKRGIVIIAPTGTGKSTQGYGLVETKKENRLHSDDWVFVNAATREVLISENQFYMRTNIAAIYPHLIPLLIEQPLENVDFSADIVNLLEQFESSDDFRRGLEDGRISKDQYHKIIEQMISNNSARSLIDPRLMVGGEKFIETTVLTDIFLLKRDYDSTLVLQVVTDQDMIDIMTSKNNVFNYEYGKLDADGYGISQNSTTEIYYNPYLCLSEVDREKEKIGPLDQIRIEAYRALARQKGVTVSWINSRLPAHQTQLCIRRFLEGGIDAVRVAKGGDVEKTILTRLRVTAQAKPKTNGRRLMDLVGYFDEKNREVEIVRFYSKQQLIDALAFVKADPYEMAGYTEGSPEDFLKRNEAIGARGLMKRQS